jgi:uroporphyrinogen decarboxylase
MKRIRMTSIERVLTALRHQEPDRIPVTLAYETPEVILQRYGKSADDLPIHQDIFMASLSMTPAAEDIRERYFADMDMPDDVQFDAWGIARWHSPTGESHSVVGPLRNAESIADIDNFPWPEFKKNASFAARVAELHRQGFAVQSGEGSSIFEQSWYLFGMERLLMALYTDVDLVLRIFDKVTELTKSAARQNARAGVDILRMGDDIADQRGMMISPEIWRKLLKPRLASVIAAAREIRPDLPVFYHSCGNVTAVIDDLIEAGVTILNPIQPEAMDPFEVKRRYGKRITLWGTIGTQTVLPHFSPEEVRRTVKEYCSVLGKGGGFIIGPSHAIKEDVPWSNIEAFYRAVEEFGVYR